MTDQQWFTTAAGVKMPWILYGTAWKKERTADLVEKAIRIGFRGIDTAAQPKHYDEQGVGVALQRLKADGFNREDLYLQTKFTPLSGQDPNKIPYDRNSPVELQIAQSFKVSLKNLQTDYIDSLVLHSPISPHSQLMKAWQAMEIIHQSGGARQLGISNCYDLDVFRLLYRDADVKPAIVQNRFYQATGYDADLRAWCIEHHVIYQSFWTLTANPQILTSRPVTTLARNYGKTSEQLFFRFLNQSGIVPLTGTCSEQHMSEDLDVFDFQLPAGEVKQIGDLLNAV